MTKYLLNILLFCSEFLYSQSDNSKFEGIITYKTTIILKERELNVDKLYKTFGRERQYYFKAGKFKWVPEKVDLEYEIFDNSFSDSILVDKYHLNDTLYYTNVSQTGDTVSVIEKLSPQIILGIPCNSAVFTVINKNKRDYSLKRTIYYPVDSLKFDDLYFKNFKAMGQNIVSSYTRSIPLRIEFDSEKQPFFIRYEATNIQWKKLDDKEFIINKSLPVKERRR